jgi:hypothetical protein
MSISWDDVVAFARTLPEVEVTTSWGTPSLKVKGRLFARLRAEDDGGLALRCAPEDKEALVLGDDPAYYTTPHYDGYAYVLVDLDRADATQVREMVDEAWHAAAPVRVRQRRERDR